MRVTLRSVTHLAQLSKHKGRGHCLVTQCGKWLSILRTRRAAGTFWCSTEEITIIVDYNEPVDCMTCLVLEARGE